MTKDIDDSWDDDDSMEKTDETVLKLESFPFKHTNTSFIENSSSQSQQGLNTSNNSNTSNTSHTSHTNDTINMTIVKLPETKTDHHVESTLSDNSSMAQISIRNPLLMPIALSSVSSVKASPALDLGQNTQNNVTEASRPTETSTVVGESTMNQRTITIKQTSVAQFPTPPTEISSLDIQHLHEKPHSKHELIVIFEFLFLNCRLMDTLTLKFKSLDVEARPKCIKC